MTLQALNRQLYARFEVIIVDDGSSPSLKRLVLDAACPYPVKYIRREASEGQAAARNIGVACASGDVIVFLDDDIRSHPWMTYCLALRQQMTRNLLVVGFRENADSSRFADWTAAPRRSRLAPHDRRSRPVCGPDGRRRRGASPQRTVPVD